MQAAIEIIQSRACVEHQSAIRVELAAAEETGGVHFYSHRNAPY